MTLRYQRVLLGVISGLSVTFMTFTACSQTTTNYTYDELGRLTQSSDSQNNSHNYSYDSVGNRVNETAVIPSSAGFRVNFTTGTENQVLNFVITRSTGLSSTQTVDYSTFDTGSAVATLDYIPISGTLTFAPGETSKTVSVSAMDDAIYEGQETFNFLLSNASGGGTISAGAGVGTITDDDPAPSIAINDASGSEGGNLTFTVTKTGQTILPASISVTAGGGTATSNSDYSPFSTSVSFTATETSKQFTMPLLMDTIYEGSEIVNLTFSGPVQATIGRSPGIGTILETTGGPIFSIMPSTTSLGFTITKSGNTAVSHNISLAVTGGTATAGADYTTITPQVFTVPANSNSIFIPVSAISDPLIFEGPETISVAISNPTNGATVNSSLSSATVTIADDAIAPRIKIATTATVTEGNSVNLTITKIIGGITVAIPISVNYATASGTAISGTDFLAQSGTVTFAPAELTKSLEISTIEDILPEPAEDFSVILTDPTVGATLLPESTAVINLNDNDGVANTAPTIRGDSFSRVRCSNSILPVLSNDSDPDGPADLPLELVSVVGNDNFSVVFNPTTGKNELRFDAPSVTGSQFANYTAKDKRGAQSSAKVVVGVIAGGACL
jgi:YD repeat-containing protein